MAGYNRWIGMGYLGKDPELKYLDSGAAVCNFSIGITKTWKDQQSGEQKKKTTWVYIDVWQKQAENVAKYCAKGTLVFIEGELVLDQWEKDGQKHSRLKVKANRVQFLSKSKKQREEEDPGPDENVGSQGPAIEDEDEVPF